MKRLLLLFCLCLTSQASVFQINSANFNDGTEYVGRYNSQLDGTDVFSFCLELDHTVGFGQSFEVQLFNLGTYSGPNLVSFQESAYLVFALQTINDLPTISAIQRAMWLINGAPPSAYLNTPDSAFWVTQAQNYVAPQGFYNNFTLVPRAGDAGQAQMLYGAVPEPSVNAMIAIGFVSLLAFLRFGRDQRRAWRKRK